MDYIYDIEVYPNVFTMTVLSVNTETHRVYEISSRRNDYRKLVRLLYKLKSKGARMVGFRNVDYDYPVIHEMITTMRSLDAACDITECAFTQSESIINADYADRFKHRVWQKKHIVKQMDLSLIHHFDNNARSTSLKNLEFNMRLRNVGDLPFTPGVPLREDQIDKLIEYNLDDVMATYAFYKHSIDHIKFRDELSIRYARDFTNHNDTKIGKTYFVMQLEQKIGPDICYTKTTTGRKPRQTKRDRIELRKIIFPYIKFKRPEFNAMLDWLNRQTITETKGVFKDLDLDGMGSLAQYADMTTRVLWDYYPDNPLVRSSITGVANLNTTVDCFKFIFGTGGLHASVNGHAYVTDDDYVVYDVDVASYYPSLSIANNLYPAHLGREFCEIYSDVKDQRLSYDKGSNENEALKLALNGVYGDSNSKYSPFYDPQYMMSITINGQLLLCMLAESLMEIANLSMIQANTDGLTVLVPRASVDELKSRCDQWEELTHLQLDHAIYSRMFIRDVNNYIAEYPNGKIKRKGKYEYVLEWHKNHSSLVVQKATEARLLHGVNIRDFIINHSDKFDFFLRAKIPRSSRLVLRNDGATDILQQNFTRYYVSNKGGYFIKIMPPGKKKPGEREFCINKGWKVTPYNTINDQDVLDINYDFYIAEAEKLVKPFIEDIEWEYNEV